MNDRVELLGDGARKGCDCNQSARAEFAGVG